MREGVPPARPADGRGIAGVEREESPYRVIVTHDRGRVDAGRGHLWVRGKDGIRLVERTRRVASVEGNTGRGNELSDQGCARSTSTVHPPPELSPYFCVKLLMFSANATSSRLLR